MEKTRWQKAQVGRGKLQELVGHLTAIRDGLVEEKEKHLEALKEAQKVEQEAGTGG